MNCHRPLLTVFSLLFFLSLAAQNARVATEKCGTMQYLQTKLQNNAALRAKFEQKKIEFNKIISNRSLNKTARLSATVYIPIVFHVVLSNTALVTDAQIQAQLDTLNKDFFGVNGDSAKIPAYFKPLFGKSNIQFCLAQRSPEGDASNGIDRVVTNKSSFGFDDAVKHGYAGGADSWNTAKYYNVWVCPLGGGILGYGTFPNDPSTDPADQALRADHLDRGG